MFTSANTLPKEPGFYNLALMHNKNLEMDNKTYTLLKILKEILALEMQGIKCFWQKINMEV